MFFFIQTEDFKHESFKLVLRLIYPYSGDKRENTKFEIWHHISERKDWMNFVDRLALLLILIEV